jgi:glycogen phosphorylase
MEEHSFDFATTAGAEDLAARVAELESQLPGSLRGLASIAYNYRWSWFPGGPSLFRDIDPVRWELAGANPVRFLSELPPSTLVRADADAALVDRANELATALAEDLEDRAIPEASMSGPIAYMCAEYGVHESLPLYSGGLGVLAGDTLKEASDRHLPLVGVGLLYRRGYHRQRLDLTGRQHESWVVSDPHLLPMARVTVDGAPLELSVEIWGQATSFHVWRVDVGHVPLFLIDADVPANDPVQRWYTARLYDGNETIRLAQYVLLGVGGARALHALGVEPALYHLNEGHPALAALEVAARDVAVGMHVDDALEAARGRFVFTTHTPVPAGNETYGGEALLAAVSDLPARLGMNDEAVLGLFRTDPGDRDEPAGLTQLAIRCSRRRNGVSRLHGEVARSMWRPLFPGVAEADVPITHVTNGAHLASFVSDPFRRLFDRHLGEGWARRASDPATWEPVRSIPDAELWEARCAARDALIDYARTKSVIDRLQRGEEIDYATSAAVTLDPATLTLGFARRLATYKRVELLVFDPGRAMRLLEGPPPLQLFVAGKAHPRDDEGKDALRALFDVARRQPHVATRAVVLEDYDLAVARRLVGGCDVWINLPRRPMEASGTSGMKATFNGALQLSVLDGWWAEAFDGANGWAIEPADDDDPEAANAHDARLFYELLEQEVIPLFHARGDDGIPHGWCEKMKSALVTCAPRFTASRMLDDYVERMYRSA